MKKDLDSMFEKPYWIMDILPGQVPANSPGQYFAAEKFFLEKPQLTAVKQKHAEVILKLNCYRDISVDEGVSVNPPPEEIFNTVMTQPVNICVDDSMIVSAPDELYLTVYNPDENLLNLLQKLCIGEGLYLWRP